MQAEDFSIPMEQLRCRDVRLMSGNDKLAEALCKTLKGEIARALSNELEKQARSGSPQFEGLQMLRFFYMEFEKEMESTQLLSMQTLWHSETQCSGIRRQKIGSRLSSIAGARCRWVR